MQDIQERVITCPECLADNHFVGTYLAPNETIRCTSCGAIAGTWADTRDAHVPLEAPKREGARIVRADRPKSPLIPESPTEQDHVEEIRVNNGLHDGQRYLNR
tara:strand:- start:365 stop:673 length:309 start_codon:yes stop_codon:yes gene_type:complete